jgi:hypothetical protein
MEFLRVFDKFAQWRESNSISIRGQLVPACRDIYRYCTNIGYRESVHGLYQRVVACTS